MTHKYNLASFPAVEYLALFQRVHSADPLDIPFTKASDAHRARLRISKFRIALRQAERFEDLAICEPVIIKLLPPSAKGNEECILRFTIRDASDDPLAVIGATFLSTPLPALSEGVETKPLPLIEGESDVGETQLSLATAIYAFLEKGDIE